MESETLDNSCNWIDRTGQEFWGKDCILVYEASASHSLYQHSTRFHRTNQILKIVIKRPLSFRLDGTSLCSSFVSTFLFKVKVDNPIWGGYREIEWEIKSGMHGTQWVGVRVLAWARNIWFSFLFHQILFKQKSASAYLHTQQSIIVVFLDSWMHRDQERGVCVEWRCGMWKTARFYNFEFSLPGCQPVMSPQNTDTLNCTIGEWIFVFWLLQGAQ